MTGKGNERLVEEAVRLVLARLQDLEDPLRIVVGVSNKHAHLDTADLKTLFGLDEMTVERPVRQPGQFAAKEFIAVHGPRASFPRVRLMGPCRARSQVELSRTDCIALGIDAPLAQSGHLDEAAPVEIEGPRGRITLAHGAMVAARHIHMGPGHAERLGLADQDLVQVRFGGQRGGVLDNFIVRVQDEWLPEIHLDTDEANALGLRTGDQAELIGR